MPNPININIGNSQRSGSFSSSVVNYPGGYSTWAGTLTGLGTGAGSDYENTSNALDIGIYYEDPNNAGSYILYAGFHWEGGPFTHHGVTDPPPPFSFGLGNLPIGNVKVTFTLTGTFTVGLSSTVS